MSPSKKTSGDENKGKIVLGTFTDPEGEESPVRILPESLTTHCFLAAMTGSGKTGLGLGMLEDVVKAGIPSVCFDVKGDLLNIAQTRNTKEGKELRDQMAVRLLTPAALHGEPVDLLSGLQDHEPEGITAAVTALLKLCNIEAKTVQSPEHNYLTQIIRTRHAHNKPVTLVDLIYAVQEPEFDKIGTMPLEAIFPPTKRMRLASAINNVLCDPNFEKWRAGVSLDFSKLFEKRPDGRTPVIVYSVAHIVEESQKDFALTIGLEALVKYMRASSGTHDLRCLAFIDELVGLIPPTPHNPPTKRPIATLLKQGRGFGVGMVLATQNPIDLDYKALGNCGTWMIGKLQTNNDRQRVIEGLTGVGAYDQHQLHKLIGGQVPRQFIIARNGRPVPFTTREVNLTLSGPVHTGDIPKLYDQGRIEPVDKAAILMSRLAEARSLYAYDESWEDRVRALENQLVALGHQEVLKTSTLGPPALANESTGEEGLLARSGHMKQQNEKHEKKKITPGRGGDEMPEEEVETQLREKYSSKDLDWLAVKVVKLKLFANKTAAKAVKKSGLIDAIVKHEKLARIAAKHATA